MFLCEGTHDLDITNSLICLLEQLVAKMDLFPKMPQDPLDAMRACAKDRSHVSEETLGVSPGVGKQMLVSLFYGGQPAKKIESLDFTHEVQRAAIYCKWIAASVCPDEFQTLWNDSSKKNPEGSILAHLYMALQDFILFHWVKFLLAAYNPTHLSLHFDGVRISDVPEVPVLEICRRSEEYIQEHAGFTVHIREKHHNLTLHLLKQRATSMEAATFDAAHKLRQPGNCILHAMAVLQKASVSEKVLMLSDTTKLENVYMEQRRCRTYEQCVELWSCKLYPQLLPTAGPPTRTVPASS